MRPAIHVILISIAATLCSADEASPIAPLKSEIPPVFTANTESFDFVRRTEMIPMRDGIKLYRIDGAVSSASSIACGYANQSNG